MTFRQDFDETEVALMDQQDTNSERGLVGTATSAQDRGIEPNDRGLFQVVTSTTSAVEDATRLSTDTSSRSRSRREVSKPVATTLYFYDGFYEPGSMDPSYAESRKEEIEVARKSASAFYHTQGIPILKWTDVAREIAKYSRIKKLIIDSHGSPGEVDLTAEGSMALKDIARAFSQDRPRQIDELYFEGCNIGQRMDDVIDFGRFMNARLVAAWTKYRVLRRNKIQVEPGDNGKAISDRIKREFGDAWLYYVLPGTNFDHLERTEADAIFWTEWFHVSPEDGQQLPAGDVNWKEFSRRGDGILTKHASPAEALDYIKDAEKFGWSLLPLHRFIVDLSPRRP